MRRAQNLASLPASLGTAIHKTRCLASRKDTCMKKLIVCAGMFAALGAMAGAAEAKGCIKGAIVGGIAGRMAGHGKVGAAAGCAVGHHRASKAAKSGDQQH